MRLIRDKSLRQRLILGISAMLVPLTLASGALILFRNTISDFYGQDSIVREEFFTLLNLENRLMAADPLIEQAGQVDAPEAEQNFQYLSRAIELDYQATARGNTHLAEKQQLLQASAREWQQAQEKTALIFDASVPRLQQEQARAEAQEHLRQSIRHAYRLKANLQFWLLDDNQARAEHLEIYVWIIISVLILLALGILVASTAMLSRWIFKPLAQLEQGIVQFGEGKLDHRIVLRHTHDELGQLAQAFNAMADELAQSQQALQRLVTLDGLTGVYNRREFNQRLTIEVERSLRDQQPVSLIMVDLDHFKKLNDTYGHQAGDEALRRVAQLLSSTVRPSDLVTRYGGEEFAVILPKTENGEALAIAERILKEVATTPIVVSPKEKAVTDATNASPAIALAEPQNQAMTDIATASPPTETLWVTASMGLASYPMDANSEEDLLSAADQALYRAKENGRNQVGQARPVPV